MMNDNLDPAHDPDPLAADFALESGPANVPDASAPAPEPRRVIVEYRRRGLPWPLVLPLLALAVIAALASYHRLMWWAYAHPAAGSSPATAAGSSPGSSPASQTDEVNKVEAAFARTAELPGAGTPPEPLSLSSHQVIPPGSAPRSITAQEFFGPPSLEKGADLPLLNSGRERPQADAAKGPPAPGPVPTTLQVAMKFATPDRPKPIPGPEAKKAEAVPARDPDAPADPPGPSAAGDGKPAESPMPIPPEKLPTREEVMEAIQKEADQKRADRAELKQFKEEAPQRARETLAANARAQRSQFLADLRTLLKQKKGEAGPEIEQLHVRYENEVTPELRDQMNRFLKRASGRMSLQAKVKALRALGLPEPAILDVICNEVHRRAHTSRCNCFDPQMYVLAARELVATELPAPKKSRSGRDDDAKAREGRPSGGPARPASTGSRAAARAQ